MKLVVGISGASGVVMGYRLLQTLKKIEDVEVHLVVSESAVRTFHEETDLDMKEVYALADYVYDNADIGAKIASGSFKTDGMIVMPCSMKTASAAANAYNENLMVRAIDVCNKERRKVVIVPREMPLNKAHINNFMMLTDMGCVIIPPVMTFYNHADTVEKQIDSVIGKVLMQFDIDTGVF